MWRRRALHGLWGQPGRFIHRSARTRMLRFFSSGAIDKLIRRIGILAKYTTAAESSALSGRTASVQVFRKRCLLPETSVFALEADAGDQANAAAIRQPTPGCSFRSSPMPSSHVWPFRNPKSSRPLAIAAKSQRKRRGAGHFGPAVGPFKTMLLTRGSAILLRAIRANRVIPDFAHW